MERNQNEAGGKLVSSAATQGNMISNEQIQCAVQKSAKRSIEKRPL